LWKYKQKPIMLQSHWHYHSHTHRMIVSVFYY